jgi:uncharacterized protein with PIN domain
MPKPTKEELDLAEGFINNELDNGLIQQIVEAAEEEDPSVKTCDRCRVPLKKRTTLPSTAVRDGLKHFDYYQCPKCKTNFAFPKEI